MLLLTSAYSKITMIVPSPALSESAPLHNKPRSFQCYSRRILTVLSTLVTTVITTQFSALGVTFPTDGTIDSPYGHNVPHLLSRSGAVPSPQVSSLQDKQAVLLLLDTMRTSANTLADELDRAYVLAELAIAYDTWGEPETAIALVEEAYIISQTTTEERSVWSLTTIAQASAQVGRSDYAEALLQGSLTDVDGNIEAVLAGTNDEDIDGNLISWDLQQMVKAAAKMDDYRTAEQILGAILDRLAEPLDERSQRRVLKAVVEAVEPWDDVAATKVLSRVHHTIEAIGQTLVLDADDLSLSLVMDDLRDLQVAIASTAASFDDDSQALPLLDAL